MSVNKLGFFDMVRNGYTAVGTALDAAAIGANAVRNMAIWADETTGAMVDEAREDRADAAVERQIARAKRQAQAAALNAPATVQTTQQTLLN